MGRVGLALALMAMACACTRESPAAPLPTTALRTPEENARLLRCEPERGHATFSVADSRMDGECDLKLDALRFLQAARTTGRLPGEEDWDALAVYFRPEGFIAEEVGPTVEFVGYEVVNPLRGPTVLRARLSSGLVLAFCCAKVKACRAERPCTCNPDCNDE